MASKVIKLAGDTSIVSNKANASIIKELTRIDPKDRWVFLFPDARKAAVGIGQRLLNCKPAEDVYHRASEILNRDVIKLCLEDPQNELRTCYIAKSIAAFVTSKATIEKIRLEKPYAINLCSATAGLGVGAFNALEFAESLSFEQALDLVVKRAQAIDRTSNIVPAAALSIKPCPGTDMKKACQAAIEYCLEIGIDEDKSICQITEKAVPGYIEIGGHSEAIGFLKREAELFNFRRIVPLNSDPRGYHTSFMNPVKIYLDKFIDDRISEDPNYIKLPKIPVYSHINGRNLSSVNQIRNMIKNEAIFTCKFEALIHALFSRSKEISQPNILVAWDRAFRNKIGYTNRKSMSSSKLIAAVESVDTKTRLLKQTEDDY